MADLAGTKKNFRLLVLEGAEKAEGGGALIAMSRNRWPTEHYYSDGEGLRSLHASSRSGYSNHSRDANAR